MYVSYILKYDFYNTDVNQNCRNLPFSVYNKYTCNGSC